MRWAEGLWEGQGVGIAGLVGVLDALRVDQEAQAAESFNDDTTYKARLNEVMQAHMLTSVRARVYVLVCRVRIRVCACVVPHTHVHSCVCACACR